MNCYLKVYAMTGFYLSIYTVNQKTSFFDQYYWNKSWRLKMPNY